MNKAYVRITGDIAEIVNEKVERVVRVSDLVAQLASSVGYTSPVLPLGCRLYRVQNGAHTFVIEQSPRVRTVDWIGMEHGRKWKLAFPYTIFILQFNSAEAIIAHSVFYRRAPLTSMQGVLSHTNLCNVDNTGKICTGGMRLGNAKGLAEKAEAFSTLFWQSPFNSDLMDECFSPAAAKFEKVSSLSNWQQATENDPLFPLSIDWRQYRTLEEYLGA